MMNLWLRLTTGMKSVHDNETSAEETTNILPTGRAQGIPQILTGLLLLSLMAV